MLANEVTKIRVSNYGFATYLKMIGYEVEVALSETGACCFYVSTTRIDFDSKKDDYFNSQFKDFDDSSRMLRDARNKLCCPKY